MQRLFVFTTAAFFVIATATNSFGQQAIQRASDPGRTPGRTTVVPQVQRATSPPSSSRQGGSVSPVPGSRGFVQDTRSTVPPRIVEIPNVERFKSFKQPDSYTCGPTSAVMIANYYGKNVGIGTMKEKAKTSSFAVKFPGTQMHLGSISAGKAGYTDPDHLVWAINDYVPTIMKEEASEQDIADAIKVGKPVIVLMAMDNIAVDLGPILKINGMHYFCIVGYYVDSGGQVTKWVVVDTNGGEKYDIARSTFKKLWNFDHVSSRTKSTFNGVGVKPRTIFIPTRPAYNQGGGQYVPGGKGQNAKIKLHELRCIKQEDYTGSDDIIIRSHHSAEKKEGVFVKTVEDYISKFWRGAMRSGMVKNLSQAREHNLLANNTGFIALTEMDDYDTNDQLGTHSVNADETNGGVTVVKFTGHATQYLLAYEVIGEVIKPRQDPVQVAGIIVVSRTPNTGIEAQKMDRYGHTWSNNDQLFWSPRAVGDQLVLSVDVPRPGTYEIYARLTKAPDYGKFRFSRGGPVVDLFSPSVTLTSPMLVGRLTDAQAGKTTITIRLDGKNPQSRGYKFGIDSISVKGVGY